MNGTAVDILRQVFNLLYLLVLAHVILSWLPVRRSHPAVRILDGLVEPLLRPFRRLLSPHRTGGLDISPMLLIVCLWVVQSVLASILASPALR
jgi:YggT family protein